MVAGRGRQADGEKAVVAVYGTLRHGQRNGHLLVRAEFLGMGQVAGRLYDLPRSPYRPYPYPALVEAAAGRVAVEIYRLTDAATLGALDALERFDPADEANSQYVRRTLPVFDGPVGAAQAYVYRGAPEELGEAVPDGDWVTFSAHR